MTLTKRSLFTQEKSRGGISGGRSPHFSVFGHSVQCLRKTNLCGIELVSVICALCMHKEKEGRKLIIFRRSFALSTKIAYFKPFFSLSLQLGRKVALSSSIQCAFN